MPLVVAMTMERLAVGQKDIASAQIQGDDVVEFNTVSIAEVQFAVATSPLLGYQEFAQLRARQREVGESPRPIQQVSIIRTGRSLDLDMSLDAGAGMRYQALSIGCCKTPVVAPSRPPVTACHPGRILPGMPPPRPMQQEREQRVTTAAEGRFGDYAVVVL
jgi:hypothetical protein